MNNHNHPLQRRGFDLGNSIKPSRHNKTIDQQRDAWRAGQAIILPDICHPKLSQFSEQITQSYALYESVLDGEECDDLLHQSPYFERIDNQFESLGSSINEGDSQEIETVVFDAIDGDNVIAEDLWMKVSWLSLHEEDASLRFRFSFGVDLVEDVAADVFRQHHAAALTDTIFPESQLVTNNDSLISHIKRVLQTQSIRFVERIIYFNAANGGAYLHHDRERGHAGVIYAQITGSTFWLTLPKQQLMHEIKAFVSQCHDHNQWPDTINPEMQSILLDYVSDADVLSSKLESFSDTALIHLMNETHAFVQQLIRHGHSHTLHAGDAILLPQETEQNCCWHSVFTLQGETGQGLSFAIRT